jgi:hypothetical protein
MRLYALYSLDKRMLAMMIVCFAVAMGISAHILGSVLKDLTSMSSRDLSLKSRTESVQRRS